MNYVYSLTRFYTTEFDRFFCYVLACVRSVAHTVASAGVKRMMELSDSQRKINFWSIWNRVCSVCRPFIHLVFLCFSLMVGEKWQLKWNVMLSLDAAAPQFKAASNSSKWHARYVFADLRSFRIGDKNSNENTYRHLSIEKLLRI